MKGRAAITGLFLACSTAAASGDGITLVASPDDAPFAGPDWPGRGMATEIIEAALSNAPDPLAFDIVWESDRAAGAARVARAQTDMGFAWARPDCDGQQHNNERCQTYHFSDPLAEVVVLLFTRTDRQFDFDENADLHGRVLCRPAGLFTHDLERPDRRWLSRDLITLKQPVRAADCFEMLMDGAVDAVALDEFRGVNELFRGDLTEAVVPLPRPLSEQSLHAVISRSHWRATAHLYRLNAGLAKLRESGRYAGIIERHLGLYWDQIKQ